ncbi:MAG: hypothetical protein K8R36_07855 [Planctomycetales bacterium]|nr:hypothetical protein [Planctomycetales bacterium]
MRTTTLTSLLIVFCAAHAAMANEQQSVGRKEAAGTGWSLTTIACAAMTLIAIVALTYAVRRFLIYRTHKSKNDPRRLLHELCKAHGLSRRAERLLRKAAAAVGTPHPGRFFLEPELLRQAETRKEMKGSKLALSLLHERLFGGDVN